MSTKTFPFSLLLMASLAACGAKKSPEDTAIAFLKHLQALEFDKAQQYADSNTGRLLNILHTADGKLGTSRPEALQTLLKMDPAQLKSAQCDINGKKAICMICCDGNNNRYPINLVQEDNKWAVSIGKENPLNGVNTNDLFNNMDKTFERLGPQLDKGFEQLEDMLNSPQFQNQMQNMQEYMNSPQFQNQMQRMHKMMENNIQQMGKYMDDPAFQESFQRIQHNLANQLQNMEKHMNSPQFQTQMDEMEKNLKKQLESLSQEFENR